MANVSKKIPDSPSPFRACINGVWYEYKAGSTASVPEEVAELIDNLNALKPIEEDPTVRLVTEISANPTDKEIASAKAIRAFVLANAVPDPPAEGKATLVSEDGVIGWSVTPEPETKAITVEGLEETLGSSCTMTLVDEFGDEILVITADGDYDLPDEVTMESVNQIIDFGGNDTSFYLTVTGYDEEGTPNTFVDHQEMSLIDETNTFYPSADIKSMTISFSTT